MEFKYYDPKVLVPEFTKLGVSGDLCPGCVFTGISPEYCFHPSSDMRDNDPIQSDLLCQHCADTVDESEEPIRFGLDKNIEAKLKELEVIREMAEEQASQ